ncbi:hypothetical protein [Rhodospirillum sp. A1_3_36]
MESQPNFIQGIGGEGLQALLRLGSKQDLALRDEDRVFRGQALRPYQA